LEVDEFLFLLAEEVAGGEKTEEGEDKDESKIELEQSALIRMELL